MKALVFGSMNLDRTYWVAHLVQPGETLSADRMDTFCGGKGFNQAIALARAGLPTAMAGAVGEDGAILVETLRRNDIDVSQVQTLPDSTGHAIIQVDEAGQNAILILAGTNGLISAARMDEVLSDYGPGDLLVAQNEISCVPELLRAAAARGMRIAFNPSPFNGKISSCDLSLVTWLLINETEGAALAGTADEEEILRRLHAAYPKINIVLTLGDKGSRLMAPDGTVTSCGIYPVQAVDTTAAGDTFTGYFLAATVQGKSAAEALHMASVAAGISVSRKGAEPSIPALDEVLSTMKGDAAP